MADAHRTRRLAHIDCPGGGQVWVDGTTLYIGHMRWPSGTTIVDVADPANPRTLARIELPEGWHSHKVRASDGVMLVNHERLGGGGNDANGFGGGLGIYDVSNPAEPDPHHQVAHRRQGRAPLHLRRPLRLHLAHGRGLCRQHRDDPRSRRPGAAAGGRPLVDPRPVAGRRRGVPLGRLGGAPLPPPAPAGRPALRQLLAPRPLHPRHRGHDPAEARWPA